MPLDTSGVTNLHLASDLERDSGEAESFTPGLEAGPDIGVALKTAREFRGLSLQDVADQTRIRRAYLAALEEMRLDELPSRPFTIGYVRAYATALGLDGEAAVARLGAAQPRGAQPATTAIEPLELAPAELFQRAPPPAVAGDAAFFVHGGAVRRVALPAGGAAAMVTGDAREGGRVSAAVVKAGGEKPRVAVAFLAETPSRLVARLHVEGAPAVLTLTPEGSEATTTALAALDRELIAVTLEARTGMSTVHARRITLAGDAPEPGEDAVIWVGGSAQAVTEIAALAGPGDDSWAFTAIEHDATHFGLARIRVAKDLARAPEVFWRDYPNGADPAPVAVGSVCGEPVVLYARPSAPAPRSPQELHAAAMGPGGLGPSRVVASAPAFANVSIATLPRGALIGYVAEGRTWAATIRCPVR